MKIMRRSEFLAKKAGEEVIKKEKEKAKHLARCAKQIEEGKLYLNCLPDDQELLDYLTKEMNEAGWGVTIQRKTVERKPPYEEYDPHVVVTLFFGEILPEKTPNPFPGRAPGLVYDHDAEYPRKGSFDWQKHNPPPGGFDSLTTPAKNIYHHDQ